VCASGDCPRRRCADRLVVRVLGEVPRPLREDVPEVRALLVRSLRQLAAADSTLSVSGFNQEPDMIATANVRANRCSESAAIRNFWLGSHVQGRRDSNSQPPVLEFCEPRSARAETACFGHVCSCSLMLDQLRWVELSTPLVSVRSNVRPCPPCFDSPEPSLLVLLPLHCRPAGVLTLAPESLGRVAQASPNLRQPLR
jgi:hypothetical protein